MARSRRSLDPEIRALLLVEERRAQRIAAWLRLAAGGIIVALVGFTELAPLPQLVPVFVPGFAAYFAIGVLSLVVASTRLFSVWWAPVFVVLDVLWYYSVLVASLLALERPPNEFVTIPVFGMLPVLIALSGMRYTPWALLVGLATFAILDTTFVAVVMSGAWPGVPPSDDPLFGWTPNIARVLAVATTASIVGVTSWRARRTLVSALQSRRERDLVRNLFGRTVPDRVAAELVRGGGALEPRSTRATVLMADVEGFTRRAENLPPAIVVTMMNAFFSAAEDVVRDHGGIVVTLQGDALLATFNLPLEQPDHADRAVDAGLGLLALAARERFAGHQLGLRVGVATGEVVAGIVGGADRVSYTVYGDVVNVAARLQAANKVEGTSLLVAGPTVADLHQTRFDLRALGERVLSGRNEPVTIYAATGSR
ncbi:MAG: adenylate/guanylate cyclase domain-containing protein [Pseudomonadota bacterium]